jgi:hypothetical protein
MDKQSAIKLGFNLKIIPTTRQGIPFGVPFIAMFNPESFSVKESVCWNVNAPSGPNRPDPIYLKTQPRKFTIEFTLDGTGVNTNGVKIPVTAQVALFRAVTTNVMGTIHRPMYLMVQYGTFINICVMNSSNITYTMFDMFGLPIRAKISAEFTERTPKTLDNILGMLSSPDLTHRVQVKEHDLLPYLTFKTYNNQDYYLQVARINKIKNFRRLEPGIELKLPPIGNSKSKSA